jgi:uncharacterized DUF497 family protein
MGAMEIEWDPKKATANIRKHGVSFADAATVLSDDLAITIEDPRHTEQRFVTIGSDAVGRILVVVYTYRSDKIQLISARDATPTERKRYER